ncbi:MULTISPECIES: thioredoxin [Flavobacterium]|uniref:Thioredoxin n=1 Tax=Flavobacterium columnare TaxID=996 RepID=A0AA94EY80_9FLAO|nr:MULTISPECIES: thioredoxin [Flavobacterium]AMA49460.1 thioredoxin [Flavobacterium covae]AND63154.1 thioredoxin [Flavobacterium covae]MCH4828731.1 thioredoxin [Flavobacterium columnare]MCH4831985.1 thioredoxin [Flavobacterium columnare]MCJ1808933.1 thioredoxin [Flavobacterium covae]
MKKFLFNTFCTALIFFTSCKGQNNSITDHLEPKVFAEKTANTDGYILDVRTPQEYNSQHLDKAINIDYNAADFENKLSQLDKNKPVYLYCLSGGRSTKAMAKMSTMGFKEIHNMTGGIMKWNTEGLSKPSSTSGMTLIEFQKLTQSDKKVLIDFYAEWCGPCKKMAPYLEKMKEEMKGKITIIKIDADKNQQLTQDLQIEGLPTLIFYKEGKEVWKNLGFMKEEELKKKL